MRLKALTAAGRSWLSPLLARFGPRAQPLSIDLARAKPRWNKDAVRLALAALGVVYGDIGTSPLYAFRECFHGPHGTAVTENSIFGVLSLVFWSLLLIVSVKYLALVMRADNRGEGGILALLSLAAPEQGGASHKGQGILLAMGVFGAALLYGDGMITPAISVLSAIEGLNVATPLFEPYVLPLTIGVLVLLFSFQWAGSGRVGRIFGPIMVVWFIAIALLGLAQLLHVPRVLLAMNPVYAWSFFAEHGLNGFAVLGAVFLVVTGSEALYADMGHFGRRPIRMAWSTLVFPALVMNYFGQGALLLRDASAAENPFYNLCPKLILIPMVLLATVATVIASQALISGAFSLTLQAIQLGYSPRVRIEHTSSAERGQIYVPEVNWSLMLACILLVLGFRTSSHLAAAYGTAVTLTMVITTVLFYRAAARLWRWDSRLLGLACGVFLMVELAYLGANLLKIKHGGWFPLLIGAVMFTVMTTWRTGRQVLGHRLLSASLPLDVFLKDLLKAHPPVRVSGTAVFLSGRPQGTPLSLLHNLKHNKVLHETVVILTILTADKPHVDPDQRVRVEPLQSGFYRVYGEFGFMDEPNVPKLLETCAQHGLDLRPEQTTYFLSRETIIPSKRPGMALWRERLFAVLSRNAQSAAAFFRLPANRVVELGMHVEI